MDVLPNTIYAREAFLPMSLRTYGLAEKLRAIRHIDRCNEYTSTTEPKMVRFSSLHAQRAVAGNPRETSSPEIS